MEAGVYVEPCDPYNPFLGQHIDIYLKKQHNQEEKCRQVTSRRKTSKQCISKVAYNCFSDQFHTV